jgi:hypothetical protein
MGPKTYGVVRMDFCAPSLRQPASPCWNPAELGIPDSLWGPRASACLLSPMDPLTVLGELVSITLVVY